MITEDKSPEELDSVWSKYGLKESPYSTSPMRLLGILPIEKVFSAREEEVRKLTRSITSSSSSRTVAIGEFGVGKTTFGNYVRWALCIKRGHKSKYITTSTEIKVQPDWDATRFLLSTLSSIYTSSIIFDWEGRGISLKSMALLEEYVSISKQKAYQGSVAGFGGGYSETKTTPPAISPEMLEHLLIAICKEIMENGKQIIIQYNNLENVSSERLADIFRSIREYIQIEGLHTIFLGPPHIMSALEKYGQVHSVFTRPIVLSPLADRDVQGILRKRCEALKLAEGNYISPYEDDTVRELYHLLNNNIRFTFKVLQDTTVTAEKSAPCKITMKEIKVVQAQEKEEIMSTLTDTQVKIVTALIDKPKLNQKELSQITGIGPTNLAEPVRQLEGKGLIVAKKGKKDKRIKYVKISDNSYLKLFFTSKQHVGAP